MLIFSIRAITHRSEVCTRLCSTRQGGYWRCQTRLRNVDDPATGFFPFHAAIRGQKSAVRTPVFDGALAAAKVLSRFGYRHFNFSHGPRKSACRQRQDFRSGSACLSILVLFPQGTGRYRTNDTSSDSIHACTLAWSLQLRECREFLRAHSLVRDLLRVGDSQSLKHKAVGHLSSPA